jgi:hypothetical protein
MAINEFIINITGDATKLTDATDATKEQLKNAGESVKMLGDLIGVTIPDAIKDMLASSELIGPALDAAFAPLAIISLGVAIYDATEKAKQHEEELKKLADEALNDAVSIGQFGEQIRLSNLRLEDQNRLLQGKPAQNGVKIALAEAGQQADQLTASIEKAIEADNKLIQTQAQGSLSRMVLGSDKDEALKNEIADTFARYQEELKALDDQTKRDQLDNTKEVENDRQKYKAKLQALAQYLTETAQVKLDAARKERTEKLQEAEDQPNLSSGSSFAVAGMGKEEAIAQATRDYNGLQACNKPRQGHGPYFDRYS